MKLCFMTPLFRNLKVLKILVFLKQKKPIFDSIVLSVPHSQILKELKKKILPLLKPEGMFFDIKGKFRRHSLKNYWSL